MAPDGRSVDTNTSNVLMKQQIARVLLRNNGHFKPQLGQRTGEFE